MFYDWCEERLEIQSLADDILAKFVPPHVNLFYCFGGLMVTAFLFQGGSGFALTSSYQPRVLEAFSSVQFILDTIHLGWFLRSLHRWSSGVIVLILILHIARVSFTGGFKKPREFLWMCLVTRNPGPLRGPKASSCREISCIYGLRVTLVAEITHVSFLASFDKGSLVVSKSFSLWL